MKFVSTSLNKKYMDYASVMVASLCENSMNEPVTVFMLHSELDESDKDRIRTSLSSYDADIRFICIDRNIIDERAYSNDIWTMEMYYRLFLPDILPDEVDRVLYLDVDVIVNHPIDEFYHMDFEDAEIAATVDSSGLLRAEFTGMREEKLGELMKSDKNHYFNSGVMLMNMDLIRTRCSYKSYEAAMEEWNYEMKAPDQDILNYVHMGRVVYVDPLKYDAFAIHVFNFDVMSFDEFDKYASIIHFSGPKPWENKGIHYPFEKIWWRYAGKIHLCKEISETFINDVCDGIYIRAKIDNLCREKYRLEKERDQLKTHVDELTKAVSEMIDMNQQLLEAKNQ